MTWEEVRLDTLRKMFSGEGDTVNESDEANQQYLAAMPQAANEALELLCAEGFGIRQAGPLERQPGEQMLDLETALPHFYPGDPLELYRQQPDGGLIPVDGAILTAGRFLRLPGWSGPITAVYTARPEPIGPQTALDSQMPLQPQAAVLMPLYMASQLYKDDDLTISTQYRNEFEAALERLHRGPYGVQGGGFSSVTGWV